MLAAAFDAVGLNAFLLALQARLLQPYVRAVNYHDVPPSRAEAFEGQLREYRERFEPVGPEELRSLLEGRWSRPRPGILLSFDDGLRSHADVVAPLLDQYGFPGWFMIPVDFVATGPEKQIAFAREHQIAAVAESEDPRIAMTWDDVRRLDGRHSIVCHTHSHRRLHASLSGKDLAFEIIESKARIERELGHEVDAFAWVGGEEESYSSRAAQVIRKAGYYWCFMTNNAPIRPGTPAHQLQRTNIEASFSPALVRFTLSGLYDLFYLPKRHRVNRLTAAETEPPRP